MNYKKTKISFVQMLHHILTCVPIAGQPPKLSLYRSSYDCGWLWGLSREYIPSTASSIHIWRLFWALWLKQMMLPLASVLYHFQSSFVSHAFIFHLRSQLIAHIIPYQIGHFNSLCAWTIRTYQIFNITESNRSLYLWNRLCKRIM